MNFKCFICSWKVYEKTRIPSIYIRIKEYLLKILFIICWNIYGEFYSPNDITFHSYNPQGHENVVYGFPSSYNLIFQNPLLQSSCKKYLYHWIELIKESLFEIL